MGRIVGSVAVVVPAAVEEHLHADLATFLVRRDHVRVVDRVGVDPLPCPDMSHRLEAVAQDGSALEVEISAGLQHLGL